MPDINIFQEPKPVKEIPLPTQVPQQTNSSLIKLPIGNMPLWAETAKAQIPYKTRLDQTLRYTDPTIGYNPLDFELEYKYADAHPYATFGNNVLKGFAKLGGTFVEALATIPLAINAAGNRDFSKLYDNDLTNGLQDWYDTLEISLPTYKNKNQTDHPIASWLSTDILNNVGGAINNLGYTAGAILGTVAEGAIITALTGGVGTLPAVGANITRFFGRFGRAVAASSETATELGSIARNAERVLEEAKLLDRGAHQMGGTWRQLPTTERGLARIEGEAAVVGGELQTVQNGLIRQVDNVAESGVARHTGTGVPNEFNATVGATRNATVNTIDKSLNTLFGITKVTDAVRYNLSLLTSAMAEGAFEANSVMRNTQEQAKKKFFDVNGYDATPEELKNIEALSKTAGNFAMGANIAILYASNRINWGSLFKPTKATAEAAIDGGLFRGYRKFGKTFNKEKGVYELLDKTPASRMGKALLYMTSPTRHIQQSLTESAEEGAQFIVSEGATDYAKRKYDGKTRGELADYIKSFGYGVDRTFNSNEGLENLVGGFVGGIFGGFLAKGGNKLRGIKNQSAKARLEQQIAGLNEETFKNIFEHNIAGAAAQQSIAKDYEAAIKSGDLFAAKNLKAELLHNWVNSAVRTNSFEARLDEVEAAKNLKGEEFTKMWGGLAYNEDNRQEAVAYLDKVKQKAQGVKKDIEKVDRLFRGNPFDKKTQPADYLAHETWKDMLARNLGLSRDYQGRIQQLQNDIAAVIPGLNVNEAIHLTSKKGISDILTKMSKAIDNLAKNENIAEDNIELRRDFREKKKALSKLFTEMQQHVFNNFEAKEFIPTLRKMYQLMHGTMENNRYIDGQKALPEPGVIYVTPQEESINDDDLVDVFERLQDLNKLHGINYQAVFSYNSLLKPSGARKYTNYVKGEIEKTNSNVNITEDGKVETPVDIERQAEEDAILQTNHMAEEDNLTKEQREQMNDIILKEAAGETLTPEEEEILKENPLYTEKVKTKEAVKAAIIKEKSPRQQAREANAAAQEIAEEKNYNEDESGYRKEVSPVELLNKLNSHEKVGKDANKNLFKAIFSKVNNFLNSQITAKLAQSDFAKEQEANGNVKQKYTPIDLYDKKGNKIGTSGIYKSRYERNIEIYHNGEMIGLLKPADSLFLDANGSRTIYEMTEAEFTNVTGMPRTEYKGYMKELNAYKKAYDSLVSEFGGNSEIKLSTLPNDLKGAKPKYNYIDKAYELEFESDIDKAAYITAQTNKSKRDADYLAFAIQATGLSESDVRAYGDAIRAYIKPIAKEGNGGLINIPTQRKFGTAKEIKDILNNETVLKYFPEIRVNTGNTIFNSSANKESDTLIKDLTHKPTGTSLISYKNENGYRKARIVNETELAAKNPTYYNKLKAFIASDVFKNQAQQNQGRYMLAVPVNGEYLSKSLIFSRPAEINETAKTQLVNLLKDNIGKDLTATQVEDINIEIANNYYIANADRTIKGTSLDLTINEDGSLSLAIYNNEKGSSYNNTINIENANITDYQSVIKTIQKAINDQEILDRNLQKLKILIKEDSIKYQIVNDKDAYGMADVESKIKVATTPNVFENYSVNFYPKGSTKGEKKEQAPKPSAPTPSQRQSIIEQVQALQPVAGKITNIDIIMAKEDTESFLKFIADQAFGVTRDQNDNRIPDGNGGNEASLIERYGKSIVDGAKALYPLEETKEEDQPRQKTEAELLEDAKRSEQDKYNAQINSEYNQKKLALHDSFINNLTEAGRKIKEFIAKNPTFVGKEVIEVQADIASQAGVTATDVTNYMQAVKNHNIQRNKLIDIAESKKQTSTVGSTGTTVFAKNQAETSIILQDLFGLPKDQADATAVIYERNRQAWVDNEYAKELAYRTENKGHSSPAYELEQSERVIKGITAKITDLTDQLDLTNDDGRKMIIQQKIDEQENKLKDGKRTLYGADLLDYINQQSYQRFGFGKKTEQELSSTDLTQDATVEQIKAELKTNKIIELNCK